MFVSASPTGLMMKWCSRPGIGIGKTSLRILVRSRNATTANPRNASARAPQKTDRVHMRWGNEDGSEKAAPSSVIGRQLPLTLFEHPVHPEIEGRDIPRGLDERFVRDVVLPREGQETDAALRERG